MNSCPSCLKSFTTQRSMTRHTREVHGTKSHRCSGCGTAYTRSQALHNHLSSGKCTAECSYRPDCKQTVSIFEPEEEGGEEEAVWDTRQMASSVQDGAGLAALRERDIIENRRRNLISKKLSYDTSDGDEAVLDSNPYERSGSSDEGMNDDTSHKMKYSDEDSSSSSSGSIHAPSQDVRNVSRDVTDQNTSDNDSDGNRNIDQDEVTSSGESSDDDDDDDEPLGHQFVAWEPVEGVFRLRWMCWGKHSSAECNEKWLLTIMTNTRQSHYRSKIRRASKSQIESLCEISENILSGFVPLSKKNIDKLSQFKPVLRQLARADISWTAKKELLLHPGK